MNPMSVQGGNAGHLPGLWCVMIDAPRSLAGWRGHCPLSLGVVRCPAGPDYRPPLWILLSHLLAGPGDLWEQLPTFVLCSLCWVQLVSSLGQDGCERRMKTVGIL